MRPFSVVPGGTGNVPWDFTSGDGMKLFHNSTKALDPKFDGDQKQLHNFLTTVEDRAESYGWTSILTIPVGGTETRSLTEEFGTITEAQVRAHAAIYLELNERNHQASACLKKFLTSSLEADILSQVLQLKAKYTITTTNGEDKESGALMLFHLIKIVSIETRSTVANIMRHLNNLPKVMEESKSDVKDFNKAVNEHITELNARRASVPEIVTGLFEAYRTCEDEKFSEWAYRKEELYVDSDISWTKEELMQKALEKYKHIKSVDGWMTKSEKELDFVAMKAHWLQASKGNGNGKKPKAQLQQDPPRTDKDGNKKKQFVKHKGDKAWKGVAPKSGEPKSKEVNGKKYVACNHGETQWALETTAAGEKHLEVCTVLHGGGSKANHGTPTKKQLTNARALAHVMEEDEAEDAEDDDDDTP